MGIHGIWVYHEDKFDKFNKNKKQKLKKISLEVTHGNEYDMNNLWDL
jgi:hypothetical protein